ncbi:MAG: ion channel [Synechococcales bacterium]|nr:ion channel [Synechococcales bacterium]
MVTRPSPPPAEPSPQASRSPAAPSHAPSERPRPQRIGPRAGSRRASVRCTRPPHQRIVTPDGTFNIQRLGDTSTVWGDIYHSMLTLPWVGFFGVIALIYLVMNALFAIAYLIGGDNIANARPGSFADAFFFSVQTMASIGYGAMYPQTTYANVVVAIEALTGLMGVAIATGLLFARFSRPTARVRFSRVAVIAPYDGVPTLMFRTANQRRNRMLEAQICVTLVRNEVTREGQSMRRFYDLSLVRSQTPIFALSWTVMHAIDTNSPLYGLTLEDLEDLDAELIVMLTGLDETFSQTVHARHSYIPAEILPDRQFADLFSYSPDGQFVIDYSRFDQVLAIAPPSPDALPNC